MATFKFDALGEEAESNVLQGQVVFPFHDYLLSHYLYLIKVINSPNWRWNITKLCFDNYLLHPRWNSTSLTKKREIGLKEVCHCLSSIRTNEKKLSYIGRGQLRLNDSAVSKPGHLKSRLVVTISPDNCLLPSSNRWEPLAIWGLFWTQSFGLIWSAKRYLITIVANIVLLSSSQLTLIFRRTRKILGYLLWTRERYACEIKAFQNWSKLFAGEDLPDCLQY